MTVKITLLLRGLDFRGDAAYDQIPDDLAELSFEAHGGASLAVIYTDGNRPVAEAAGWGRRIRDLVPAVTAVYAHDELVSIPDIAARCDVAAEAVRLWAAGKRRASLRPFPAPRQVVGNGSGGKTMSLFAWREVLSWVREIIHIDPDKGISYLDDRQYAELAAALAGLSDSAGTSLSGWRHISLATQPVVPQAVAAVSSGVVGSYTPMSGPLRDDRVIPIPGAAA